MNIEGPSQGLILVRGRIISLSGVILTKLTWILATLLLLWVHTISDDTTDIVFFEAKSY